MTWLPILALIADLAAAAWSALLLHRLRDRRLAFFLALPLLLGAHQFLMLLSAIRGTPVAAEDATGLVVSLLVLLAVASAGRSLEERRASQDALRRETVRLDHLFSSSPEAIVLLDRNEVILAVNPEFERLFGYTAEEVVGRVSVNELLAPDDLRREADALSRRASEGETVSAETVRRRKDGSLVHVSILGAPIRTEQGSTEALYGIYRDITERKQAEEALRRSEERYALAATGAGGGLWDWDLLEDRIYFSPRWKEMLGYGVDDIGSAPSEWLARVHPEDRATLEDALAAHTNGRTPHFENEHRILHKNGTYPWMMVRGKAVRDDNGFVYRMAGSQIDVTERRLAEEQLRHAALHDGLTGLPNRTLFSEILENAFDRMAREPGYSFAVLFLDLDRFKVVNDSLGHLAGDRVLQAVARRLRTCLREGDAVARLAGDEFIVFLEGVEGADYAVGVAERIQETLREPFDVGGQEVVLTSGVGIVLSDCRYGTPEEILRDADIAMYKTKSEGGGTFRLFDPEMHREAVARMQLETDLRRALERDELQVLFQPIVDLESDRIAGFEALVRWRHPDRGLVTPVEFIETAEETGLIVEVGQRVLDLVTARLARWQDRFGAEAPFVSVNLSLRQLRQTGFLGRIGALVAEAGIDADNLNVEITESALMDGAEHHLDLVSGLRGMGVDVHIDDFGTGYSSLSYLHRFAVQALKIDRSFVAGICEDGGNREIVQSIVTLAGNLGMEVIAEGVETREQAELLRGLRCPLGQGYFFSHPLDAASADELLERQARSRAAAG